MTKTVDCESPRISEAFESIFAASPWPVIAFDDRDGVLAASDEPSNGWSPPSGREGLPLRSLAPHYLAQLSGAGTVDPLVADSVRVGPRGTDVHERLHVRRTAWGRCMTIVDQTEVRQLQTVDIQTARLATLGFMVAGVCHEMTNPLTALHSIVQILQAENPLEPPILEKGLDNIGLNVKRLLDISRRLVKYSRASDEPRLRLWVDDIVDDALAALHEDGSLQDVEIHRSRAPGAIVFVNAGQIQEIFVNLLVNAVQAMGARGRLTVETCCAGPSVEVLIGDSGPGIADGAIERIFEPFFTTKTSVQGTGLGLAISSEFAREHGGTVELRRTSPAGAVFAVTLPKELS